MALTVVSSGSGTLMLVTWTRRSLVMVTVAGVVAALALFAASLGSTEPEFVPVIRTELPAGMRPVPQEPVPGGGASTLDPRRVVPPVVTEPTVDGAEDEDDDAADDSFDDVEDDTGARLNGEGDGPPSGARED